MQDPLRKDDGKRNDSESYRVLSGRRFEFYGSGSTHYYEVTPCITGEGTVSDIKRAKYSEVFVGDEEAADRWFKCRLFFITLDEKSGAEKKAISFVLVQAADLRDAVRKLDEGMKDTMADYQIGAVTATAIVDVYPYGSTA